MAKKYVRVRVPKDAYLNLKAKKMTMEQRAKYLLGRPTSIPLTNIVRLVSGKSITVQDKEIIKLTRRKKR